jgi:formylglycine-generating enzyme required for sulfatase activity
VRKEAAPIPADVPAMRSLSYGATRFAIDTFEAGKDDDGGAISGMHTVPATGASWHDAKDACRAAGKRLCTAAEWLTACQGAEAKDDNGNGRVDDDALEGTLQPYGDVHRPRLCWDGHKRDAFRPVYTGEHPGCVSRDGVYDLTGNMAEWVGASEEQAALMGGMYEERRPSCVTANFNWGPDQSAIYTGFRCCADAEVGQ